ncbi:site-specific integrase [Hymenobacter sp. GOD-10R]|uniref:site-specific integrase n=1 Tax=Hymenobacter sp. GOD-10R TaxID=3093922 RepID=UPI002D7962AF|nr:site-specific integrase [Hymenobacter sp. GOD-10R]WRQ29151.1 site-specific integrase [Hymenobacter sp. GOD-10R]
MLTIPKIHFWFRKNPRNADRPGSIVCRLTVTKKSEEETTIHEENFATGVLVQRTEWNTHTKRVNGRKEAAMLANLRITKIEDRLTEIIYDLERQKQPITCAAILRQYNAGECPLSLIQLLADYQRERESLIGVEISLVTYKTNGVWRKKITQYLEATKQIELRPDEVKHTAADKMVQWLLVTDKCNRNYVAKITQYLGQVLEWGVRREYLSRNPLKGYKCKKLTPKELVYLTPEQIHKLATHSFKEEGMQRVVDCFLFQCWTGLSYSDLEALDVAKAAEARNGRRILHVTRKKSTLFQEYKCVIPLSQEAEMILGKYNDHLPVTSGQHYNRYLKEVAKVIGFKQNLTTHIGRKTAGVMLLNKGMRMETVSKVLGHASVRLTEKLYAKILDNTVADEFDAVFGSANAPDPYFEPEPEEHQTQVISFRFGA